MFILILAFYVIYNTRFCCTFFDVQHFWSGVYGKSFFDGSQPAPVLVIGPNTENNTVPYLDGVELKNYAFESVKIKDGFHPVLCWNLDSNETAGNITFYYTPAVTSGSTLPTGYTGNWFQGTLQTSANSLVQNYHGAIGESTDENALPKLNLGISEDVQSFWDKYSTYVYVAIAAVASVVIIGVLVYRNRRVADINLDEANMNIQNANLREQNDNLFVQQLQQNEPTKTVDEWIADFANPSPLTGKGLENAKAHFSDQAITKERLLQFISEQEKETNDLSTGRYVDEGLDVLISNLATEIPFETISLLVASPHLVQNEDWLSLIENGQNKDYFNQPQVNDLEYQTWLNAVKTQLKEALYNSNNVPVEIDSKNILKTADKQQPLSQAEKKRLVDEKKAEIQAIFRRQGYQNPANVVNAEIEIRQLLQQMLEIDPDQPIYKDLLAQGFSNVSTESLTDFTLMNNLKNMWSESKKQWNDEFNERPNANELRKNWNRRIEENPVQKPSQFNRATILERPPMSLEGRNHPLLSNDFQNEIIQPPSDLKPIETQPKKNYQYTFEKQKPLTQEQKDQRKDEVFQYIEKFGNELKPYYVGEMDGLTPNSQEYNDKLAKIKEDLKSKSKGYIEEHGSYPPFGRNVLYPSKEYRQKVIDKTAISDEAQRKQVSEDLDTIFQKLKVDLDRRQEYLKNTDILVKKAKSQNSNMTREQAETWFFENVSVFDPDGNDSVQVFLENFKPEKSDRPEKKKTQFEKPDSKMTSKLGDKAVSGSSPEYVVPSNQKDPNIFDTTGQFARIEEKNPKTEDRKKLENDREKPHDFK